MEILMPVDVNLSKEDLIYQREQYQKGSIGRRYWDFRDDKILDMIWNEKLIVDVGCGEGILIEKAVKRFPDKKIFGIDFSTDNIKICKEHGLEVYHGSVYELPLNNESVDCVLFTEVIEHLDYPEKALREIKRVLKNGGKLILLFPNDSMFKLTRILTFKIKEAFYDAGHVKQWHPGEMTKVLTQEGFEIIYKKNMPFHLWLISLHCLIAAKKI